MHHNFVDFRKAVDRVRRRELWTVLRKYNFGNSLTKVMEASYNDSSSLDKQ